MLNVVMERMHGKSRELGMIRPVLVGLVGEYVGYVSRELLS